MIWRSCGAGGGGDNAPTEFCTSYVMVRSLEGLVGIMLLQSEFNTSYGMARSRGWGGAMCGLLIIAYVPLLTYRRGQLKSLKLICFIRSQHEQGPWEG